MADSNRMQAQLLIGALGRHPGIQRRRLPRRYRPDPTKRQHKSSQSRPAVFKRRDGRLNSFGNDLLTPREEQVVPLVAEGLSNRQIAIELNLSQHTVKKYLFRIFDKLGISTRVELVLYAVNNGDARQAEWLVGTSWILPSA